jgi:gamma-glutamylcyclotransferase (GGCT)/AIG2-like uncharacterized protein YtfP
MGEGRERIFLYGTLRRGGTRDVERFYGGAEFVACARVRGVLHDFVDYPGLRLSADADWVRGELFDVTAETLAGLDEWEGIDPAAHEQSDYRRLRLLAERDDGVLEECWGYEVVAEKIEGRPVIASGDWITHVAGRR